MTGCCHLLKLLYSLGLEESGGWLVSITPLPITGTSYNQNQYLIV